MLKNFGQTAEKLSGNPLGIIALFIVLLYGIAGLVLGTSATSLTHDERAPIVWFLVTFPFLVLLVFTWLVSQHHTKLYAPKDYLSDEAFLRALTPTEKREKQEDEISKFEADGQEQVSDGLAIAVPRSSRQYVGAMQDYRLAEDLAIKHLRTTKKLDILGGGQELRRGDQKVQVDGVEISRNMLTAFEVHLIHPKSLGNNLGNRMAEVAYKAMQLAALSKANAKLVYVAVVDGLTQEVEDRIRNKFQEVSSLLPIPVELVFLDFNTLKDSYRSAPVA
jgi:hypothetical protein